MMLVVILATAAHGAEQSDQISLSRKSKSGLEGWTIADSRHSKGAWMNRTLVIKTKKGKKKTFPAEYAFIVGWDFCRADSGVVIQSQNAHGPYYWQLFDIPTGRLLDSFYRSKVDNFPEWAHQFAK